jgi:hypothetical protein
MMSEQNCKTWTATLEEADDGSGDLVLLFPQDMLDEVGWNTGDNLKWLDRGDGTWEIKKVNNESEK